MRCVFVSLLFFAFCVPATASEKYGHGDGGSLRPYEGCSKSIRLISEKIRITLLPDSTNYDVLTDYLFVNEGPNCTAQMFIPVSSGGLNDNQSDLTGLSVSADGFKTSVKRQVLKTPDESESYYHDVRWNTKIKFRTQQKRHIRVCYRSNLWGSSGESLFYLLSGNSWHGRVGETTLLLVGASKKETRSASYNADGEMSKGVRFSRKRNHAFSQWKNWNPVGAFQVY